MSNFIEKARTVNECLHAYGIHSSTLQPETTAGNPVQDAAAAAAAATSATASASSGSVSESVSSSLRRRRLDPAACQMICSNLCHNLMCCTKIET